MGNINTINTRRTLTFKSKIGFGRYAEQTVLEMIDNKKEFHLQWIYYNCLNIDFIPDVLDMIKITYDYRLIKPAKNPDMLKCLRENIGVRRKYVKLNTIESKEKQKIVNNTFKGKERVKNSRKFLMSKNHGK